jgi:hypothetical protein
MIARGTSAPQSALMRISLLHSLFCLIVSLTIFATAALATVAPDGPSLVEIRTAIAVNGRASVIVVFKAGTSLEKPADIPATAPTKERAQAMLQVQRVSPRQ